MLYKCEPQTQILTAGHWSRQFVTFAVTAGAMPKNFDLKVSNIKARCHAIFSYNQEIKTTTKKRHQVSSSTSDRTCIVKTEEDGVNLKNVGSIFGLVSGDNPA